MLIWSQAQAFLCMWLLSAFVESLLRFFWSLQCFHLYIHVADGVSECSATLDDSVSEEEEGSFDELTDVTPYLQPGVELSVLSEVRLREGILSRCNTCKDLFQNVLLVSDAVLILPPCWLTNSCAQMLMCPFPRCLASVQQNTQPVLGPQAYT